MKTAGATIGYVNGSQPFQYTLVVWRWLSPARFHSRPNCLLLSAALLRRLRGLRRDTSTREDQPVGYPLAKTFDRELAISQLRSLVLGDRASDWAQLSQQARPLTWTDRIGTFNRPDRLDARFGLVRVLATRAGRPRRRQLNFCERDLDVAIHYEVSFGEFRQIVSDRS